MIWVPPTTLGFSQLSIDFFDSITLDQKIHYVIHGGTPPPEVGEGGRVLTGAQHVLARIFFGHPSVLVEYVE